MNRKVKCNKCGYVGDESEFPTGRDLFQHPYIKGCPKCGNRQTPGGASMRMFDSERPFVYLREHEPAVTGTKIADVLPTVLHGADEAG